MQAFEDLYGFGMMLFYVPDDHIATDELIESKHGRRLGAFVEAPFLPKATSFIIKTLQQAAIAGGSNAPPVARFAGQRLNILHRGPGSGWPVAPLISPVFLKERYGTKRSTLRTAEAEIP